MTRVGGDRTNVRLTVKNKKFISRAKEIRAHNIPIPCADPGLRQNREKLAMLQQIHPAITLVH